MTITINFPDINWLSVCVVTILAFPLGTFWHSRKIFGKAWAADAKPVFDGTKKVNYIKLFGFSAILHFVAMTGLDLFIGINSSWILGLYSGLGLSAVFVFTTLGVTYLFAGRTYRLLFIDAGFYIIYFSIAGAILGAW
jgi:hypothetical protein